MKKETIDAVKKSIAEIEEAHPELYAVIASLAEALSCAVIDPESGLAKPAADLVAAFEA